MICSVIRYFVAVAAEIRDALETENLCAHHQTEIVTNDCQSIPNEHAGSYLLAKRLVVDVHDDHGVDTLVKRRVNHRVNAYLLTALV